MTKLLTNLDLVNKCDALPDPERDPKGHAEAMKGYYTVVCNDSQGPVPIGYMPAAVVDVLLQTPVGIRGEVDYYPASRSVAIFPDAATEAERTECSIRLAAFWRERQAFAILRGWRDELWPVYGRDGELLFKMERTAVGLFGLTRYGIHMVAWTRAPAGDTSPSAWPFRIWVPRRAATKSTYAGMLDNTVAGGLAADDASYLDALVREADEEASLPEGLVRRLAREVGTITYVYVTDPRAGGEAGLVYPECQWVYDLELPADGCVVPRPKDGEVESFALHTVEEIRDQMARGEWKPNCAVVTLDFFVRHGIVTRENEEHFDEIRRKMHRRIPFPGPHEDYHPDDLPV